MFEEKIELIRQILESAELGDINKQDIIQAKETAETTLDDIKDQMVLEQRREARGDARIVSVSESQDGDEKTMMEELSDSLNTFNEYLSMLNKVLEDYKNFDKNRFFKNLDTLLKQSDVKIGQIEKDAGVRLGYAARLKKPDSTTEPSMEFVVTAAKLLGVSVDYIINARIEDLTPSEQYLLRFTSKIIQDTKEDKLFWERESASILNTPHDAYASFGQPHPLFTLDTEELDSGGAPYLSRYQSAFLTESQTEITGNVYHAVLNGTNGVIYIVPCRTYLNDEDKDGKCFELYLLDKNNIVPICNTLLTSPAVIDAISDLYKQVMMATSHVQLTKTARNIMDMYLNGNDSDGSEDSDSSFLSLPFDLDEELPFS